MTLDRREFLKASAVGIGALSADGAFGLTSLQPIGDTLRQDYPYRGWEDIYRDEYGWDEVGYAAHCVNCHGNCSFRVLVKDGIVVREEQTAAYPRTAAAYRTPIPAVARRERSTPRRCTTRIVCAIR